MKDIRTERLILFERGRIDPPGERPVLRAGRHQARPGARVERHRLHQADGEQRRGHLAAARVGHARGGAHRSARARPHQRPQAAALGRHAVARTLPAHPRPARSSRSSRGERANCRTRRSCSRLEISPHASRTAGTPMCRPAPFERSARSVRDGADLLANELTARPTTITRTETAANPGIARATGDGVALFRTDPGVTRTVSPVAH